MTAETTYRDTTHPAHARAALYAFAESSGGSYASDQEMIRDLISAALRLAHGAVTDIPITVIADRCAKQAIEDQADAVDGILVFEKA